MVDMNNLTPEQEDFLESDLAKKCLSSIILFMHTDDKELRQALLDANARLFVETLFMGLLNPNVEQELMMIQKIGMNMGRLIENEKLYMRIRMIISRYEASKQGISVEEYLQDMKKQVQAVEEDLKQQSANCNCPNCQARRIAGEFQDKAEDKAPEISEGDGLISF